MVIRYFESRTVLKLCIPALHYRTLNYSTLAAPDKIHNASDGSVQSPNTF